MHGFIYRNIHKLESRRNNFHCSETIYIATKFSSVTKLDAKFLRFEGIHETLIAVFISRAPLGFFETYQISFFLSKHP